MKIIREGDTVKVIGKRRFVGRYREVGKEEFLDLLEVETDRACSVMLNHLESCKGKLEESYLGREPGKDQLTLEGALRFPGEVAREFFRSGEVPPRANWKYLDWLRGLGHTIKKYAQNHKGVVGGNVYLVRESSPGPGHGDKFLCFSGPFYESVTEQFAPGRGTEIDIFSDGERVEVLKEASRKEYVDLVRERVSDFTGAVREASGAEGEGDLTVSELTDFLYDGMSELDGQRRSWLSSLAYKLLEGMAAASRDASREMVYFVGEKLFMAFSEVELHHLPEVGPNYRIRFPRVGPQNPEADTLYS